MGHPAFELAVVVAGGRGLRLAAGVPKALARHRNTTLLGRALELARSLAGEVRWVVPAGMALPHHEAVRRIDDPPGETGPLGALVAGLLDAPYEGAALVLAVDMPGLTAAALLGLAAERGDAPAVIASVGGIPQPLAGGYTLTAAARLAECWSLGERSLTRAALAAGARVVAAESLAGGMEQWLNVNTPEDLARANGAFA